MLYIGGLSSLAIGDRLVAVPAFRQPQMPFVTFKTYTHAGAESGAGPAVAPSLTRNLFTTSARILHRRSWDSLTVARLLQAVDWKALAIHRAGLLIAALCLVLTLTGCASKRPAPILVQHQRTVASTGNAAAGSSLKLLTYNIWGLPSWINHARADRYPQIATELQRLDPDIILLQEAWTDKARESVPTNGFWSVARAAGQHSLFQQNGLMTLSKFPILGGEFYPFSREGFPDRFVNKGVLKVTVLFPGGQVLNIWNLHLDSGRWKDDIRRSQIRELLAHVQAANDGQCADLVAGDFNCTPESPLYRELQSALGPNVQQLGGVEPSITWQQVSAKPGPGRTVDYIFVKSRGSLDDLKAASHVAFNTERPQDRLSDHLALEAVVTLDPGLSLAHSLRAGAPISSLADMDAELTSEGSE